MCEGQTITARRSTDSSIAINAALRERMLSISSTAEYVEVLLKSISVQLYDLRNCVERDGGGQLVRYDDWRFMFVMLSLAEDQIEILSNTGTMLEEADLAAKAAAV
ncbi:hypothetical protein ACWGNZ_00775 [Sphingomonas zeae]